MYAIGQGDRNMNTFNIETKINTLCKTLIKKILQLWHKIRCLNIKPECVTQKCVR